MLVSHLSCLSGFARRPLRRHATTAFSTSRLDLGSWSTCARRSDVGLLFLRVVGDGRGSQTERQKQGSSSGGLLTKPRFTIPLPSQPAAQKTPCVEHDIPSGHRGMERRQHRILHIILQTEANIAVADRHQHAVVGSDLKDAYSVLRRRIIRVGGLHACREVAQGPAQVPGDVSATDVVVWGVVKVVKRGVVGWAFPVICWTWPPT